MMKSSFINDIVFWFFQIQISLRVFFVSHKRCFGYDPMPHLCIIKNENKQNNNQPNYEDHFFTDKSLQGVFPKNLVFLQSKEKF